ncbi:tetratricopeptide repeat protein [Streptomyces sp. NPDC002755]|uniref:tetratricopeptide repeat protein n=1 Tax=Streptomyces sp. NPDC002884 TaxID=3154544 RepID=UPI00332E839E
MTTAQQADSLLEWRQPTQTSNRFTDRDAALAWFDDEMLNLTTAVTGAVASGRPEAGIGLATALNEYLHRCLAFPMAVAVHEASFACAVHIGSLEGRAKSLNNLGIAYTEVERYEDAITAFTLAEEAFADLGDRFERGKTLNGLGNALRHAEQVRQAAQVHQEALRIQREVGGDSEQASTLNNLSLDHQSLDEHPQALRHATEAALLYAQLDDREKESKARCTMAAALKEMGRPQEALENYDRAIDAVHGRGSAHQEGVALAAKGEVLALALERTEDAVSCWTEAVKAFEQTNERLLRVQVLMLLGLALAQLQRHVEAMTHLHLAADLCRHLGMTEELEEVRNCLTLVGG